MNLLGRDQPHSVVGKIIRTRWHDKIKNDDDDDDDDDKRIIVIGTSYTEWMNDVHNKCISAMLYR